MFTKNFIDYAIILLLKDRADHFFSFLIFSFIVFILSSVLFISHSLEFDILQSIASQPDIVVEDTRAGKAFLVDEDQMDEISRIAGVSKVEGAIDGYYYFAQQRLYFHVLTNDTLKRNEMMVGQGVKKAMSELYYEDQFHFITENGIIKMHITQVAPKTSTIISNDVIYLHHLTARRVLGLKNNEYSKMYVTVPNSNEVGQIALKIVELYPSMKATTKEDIRAEYQHIFYYKGGIFMVMYVVSMVSFFILLKNQISLVYGEKKKEIAILRSIGFCIKDIIALKFIQNFVVALSAYLLGIACAYVYVFFFNAPLLREIFLGSMFTNTISLTPVVDANVLFLIFIFGVIPFLAFVIIPSWKIAISDMSEAIK